MLRTVALFKSTGQVSKRPYPADKAFRKLTDPAQLLVLHMVLDKPGITLREIQNELQNTLLLDLDTSTICRFLHTSGFSRQRLRTVAIQRDEVLRLRYTQDMSVFSAEMLVFIDETGADRRNIIRQHGYSLRGKPMCNQIMLVRGERVSAIACIAVDGLLDVRTVRGTTDGDTFYEFVQTHLLQHLMPFNGVNPRSVVVLDNCSIHHIPEIVASIEDVGALVYFLPPYSPDFNPIEEAFSKVKTVLRSTEVEMANVTDVELLLLASFTSITPDDCYGWFSHSGIYFFLNDNITWLNKELHNE